MKRTNKWMAMALAGVMMVGVNASSVFATDALTIRENTAKFQLTVERNIWGAGQNYEGHQGRVTIKNVDVSKLSDWVLEFEYDGEIKSVSNAVLVSHVGNRYVVKAPKAWNQTIAVGKSLTFEYQGKKTAGDLDFNKVYFSSTERPVNEMRILPWVLKGVYSKGDVVVHDGRTYKCIQGHTAHAFNWTPDLTPAIWAKYTAKTSKPYDVVIEKY